MKRICNVLVIAAAAILLPSAIQAQYLKAGVNFANVSVTNDGRVDDAKSLTSFHVGFMGDIALSSFFSLQPGIYFTGKGTKSQDGQTTDANYYRATTNPWYIEVPVLATLKIPMSGSNKFFVGAGPYAAIGVAGKNKVDGKVLGVSFSSEDNIDFSNDDPTTDYEEGAGFGIMKRFDYGINATAGFEFSKAMISLNYGLGLAKLQSGTTNGDDNDNKHRVFSISVGFRL